MRGIFGRFRVRDGGDVIGLIACFGAMAIAYRITLTNEHDIIEGLGIIAAGVFAQFISCSSGTRPARRPPLGRPAREPRRGSTP